jgi:hypothetical protein
MREKVFVTEVVDAVNAAGGYAYKIPDQPAGRFDKGQPCPHCHKLLPAHREFRFNVPKPCDIVGHDPIGRFLALECKLERTGVWHADDRALEQAFFLLTHGSAQNMVGLFAINFRFTQKKLGHVLEAFLVHPGKVIDGLILQYRELADWPFDWKDGICRLHREHSRWLISPAWALRA